MSSRTNAPEFVSRRRSLLFVPASDGARIERAHERGADAIIVDLEDGVAPARKPEARRALPGVLAALGARGCDVLLRVNADPAEAAADLAAAGPGVRAIVAPKVEDAAGLRALDRGVEAMERRHGMPRGSTGIIATIESPRGLLNLAGISESPRVIGLALGSEDFAAALGVQPGPQCLSLPCQMIALTACAHGQMAIGVPGSIANYRALDAFSEAARAARAMGLTGAFCIHPAQVDAVNAAFAPSETDVAWALAVDAAWREAGEHGVTAVNGEMIDKPVAQRARTILARRTSR